MTLARISPQGSAAPAQLPASPGRVLVRVLDRLQACLRARTCGPTRIYGHLHGLATIPGEKCGLVRLAVLGVLLLQLAGCTAWLPPGLRDLRWPTSERGAVVRLLEEAQDALDAGNQGQAAAALERALRIAPRNPLVWHRLASLRLQQGDPAQAASLAAKSNSLARADRSLQAANWRLIGAAREQAGDRGGAEQAFTRARDLTKGRWPVGWE